MKIDPDGYYKPDSPELTQFAQTQTLAMWRHTKVGPDYIKAGRGVVYKGSDVLSWLKRGLVSHN